MRGPGGQGDHPLARQVAKLARGLQHALAVRGVTPGRPFSARSTVADESPALRAMSTMVVLPKMRLRTRGYARTVM